MKRISQFRMSLLGGLVALSALVMTPESASAQVVFPKRTVIQPILNNPTRKNLGKSTKIDKSLFAKPKKGARGAKRGPKTFKKITLDRFKKFAKAKAKKKGARGAKKTSVEALLKKLKKGGKVTLRKAEWASAAKAKKGARGKRGGPPKIKKEISTDAYLAELNKLEKQANAKGYSLLDGSDEVQASAFVSNDAQLASQAKKLKAKGWGTIKPLTMPKTPRFAGLKIGKKGARGGKAKSRLRMLNRKNAFKIGKLKKSGSRGAKKKGAVKLFKKEYKDEIKYGNNKTASVGFGYRFFTKVDTKGVVANSHVDGKVHVFGKKFEVFKITGDMSGKIKGKHTTAKLTAKIVGVEKVIFDHDSKKKSGARGAKKKKALWSKADRKSYDKEVSHRIDFVLAFIPVYVEVGAAFSAGVEYKVSVNPTSVSAEITPYLNADGFARFAINILIAEAGIEGRVTLIDLELRIMGEGGVAHSDKKGLYAYAFFAGDLAMEALSGALSVFLKVNLLVVSKKFTHTLWKWKGIVKTSRLFELKKEVSLFGGDEQTKAVAKKNTGPAKNVLGAECDEGTPTPKDKTVCVVHALKLGADCTKAKCDRYRFVTQGKLKGVVAVKSKSRKKGFKRIYECKEGEQRSRAKNSRFAGLSKNSWCVFWSGKLKNGKRLKHGSKCPGNACPYWLDSKLGGVIKKAPSAGKSKKAKAKKKPAKRFGASVGLALTKSKSKKTVWIIEASGAKGWIRLKNKATGKYLHNEKGRLALGKISKNWWSAMWDIENGPSRGFMRIQSRWKPDRYVHNQHGGLEATGVNDNGWWSAQWSVSAVPGSTNIRLKNRWKGTYLSAK